MATSVGVEASSSAHRLEPAAAGAPEIIWNLVVKVAARCNIDCSYCYWFRDPAVFKAPKLMSEAVADQLLLRVKEHVLRYSPEEFYMVLHGGEPLLWGRANFQSFADKCRVVEAETGTPVRLATTTNGVLIDEDWVDCFERNQIGITVSIDGPAHIHDAKRKTFAGGPTHATVERGIGLLQKRGVPFGVLAVCNPTFEAKDYVDYFSSIDASHYDILLPDSNFDSEHESIGRFYRDLFDLWLAANEKERTVRIRTIEAMLSGLIGGKSESEAFGYGSEELCTILTDGTITGLDVLRIADDRSTRTTSSVFDHALQDVTCDPGWQAARQASLTLSAKCRACKFMTACGGGYLPHRFSSAKGYDNPSVYCDDLYSILEHMQREIAKQVFISRPDGGQINVHDAATNFGSLPVAGKPHASV
jgi:uncharacterized protein